MIESTPSRDYDAEVADILRIAERNGACVSVAMPPADGLSSMLEIKWVARLGEEEANADA